MKPKINISNIQFIPLDHVTYIGMNLLLTLNPTLWETVSGGHRWLLLLDWFRKFQALIEILNCLKKPRDLC